MRRRVIGLLTSTVSVMAALALTAPAPSSAVSATRHLSAIPPNIDVSQMRGNHAEDTVAANPTDPMNVVAMSMTSSRPFGLFVGVTFNGGQTWSRRVIGTGGALGQICCDEDLAWDRYGNLWLSYLPQTNNDLAVAVSTDGGLKFTKVTEIKPIAPNVSAGQPSERFAAAPALRFALGLALRLARGLRSGPHGPLVDQPHIAVGPHSVWVSWGTFASIPAARAGKLPRVEASGAKVSGAGRFGRFTRPEVVPTSQGLGDLGDTAVGPHGQVMVTYQNNVGTRCCSRIYTAVDPDGLGHRSFGKPRLLARSNVGGFFTIPAQPGQGVYAEPKLAWYGGPGPHHGRVYAVWTAATPRLSDNLNIMFRYSDNDGRTWTKARRLSDPRTAGSQFFPAIAVDQATGDLAVGWYDCRDARGQGGAGCRKPDSYAQFWATTSTDAGATFAPDFQVSQGTSNAKDSGDIFDYGDYTHVAFQSHLFYPVWSDNSDSTGDNPNGTLHKLDLYLAIVDVP